MNLHIGVLCEDGVPHELFDEFEKLVRVDGLQFERHTRPRTPFAGFEWLMPTVVVAYIAKPYFESFLKEMGKDHYTMLKGGLNKLFVGVAGPDAPDVKLVSTAGKAAREQPYSLFFSVVAEIPNGMRLKLLIPRPIDVAEYELAISKFLDLVRAAHERSVEPEIAASLQGAPTTSGTVLITYETETGKLVPVDPLAGRRSAPSSD